MNEEGECYPQGYKSFRLKMNNQIDKIVIIMHWDEYSSRNGMRSASSGHGMHGIPC